MNARADIIRDLLAGNLPAHAVRAEQTRRAGLRAEKSLHCFLQEFAWPVLQPGTPFVDNWHIHAICEHLEAVSKGQIQKLIINMPFRALKSTIISQAWPAWEWGPFGMPYLQYLTASYARDLATRDAVDARRIIESDKYQQCWADVFCLTTDQNVKTRYQNDHAGTRVITSTDSAATGFGGNRRIIDDPISAKDADNELARKASVEWWKGTMATRANDPERDASVVVHQRMNELDLTGHLLAEEDGWDHLVLPMRYDPENVKITSLGFVDPRKKKDELLQPGRLGEVAVKALEKSLGQYHTDAQLNQNPSPRGGVIFNRNNWKYYTEKPKCEQIVVSVDCSFKDLQTSDYVAIHVWGRTGPNKYLLHRVRERLGFGATCIAVNAVVALFPSRIAVLIEDKANGSAVLETLKSKVSGLVAINPEGGKVARAYAMQPEHENGNIWLPDPSIDPKIEVFISSAASFPAGAHDDEEDAMTQAINWYRTGYSHMGMMDYYRQEAEKLAAEKAARQAA